MLVFAATHPDAAELLRDFVAREIIARVASSSRRKDAKLRAALAGSQLIDAALARYVYEIPPLSDAPIATVANLVGDTLDYYLVPGARRKDA